MLTRDRKTASPAGSHSRQRPSLSLLDAVLATGGAIGLNLLIYAIAKAGGVDFVVPSLGNASDTTTVNAVNVVLATLVGLGVGWLAVLAASRIGRPSLGAVAVAGGVVAVTSCAAPLMLDANIDVRSSLAIMHLVVGTVYVFALRRIDKVER